MIYAILIGLLLVAGLSVRLYFLKTMLGKTRRLSEGEFLLAFSGLLAQMAMADGSVSADEIETVEKMFADMGLSRAEQAMCVGNFVLVQREWRDAREFARTLAASLTHVACRFLYGLVLRVAQADWRIADEEEAMLNAIGVELGLSDDERAEFRRGAVPAFDERSLEDAGVPPALVRLGKTTGIKDGGLGIWDR